MTIIKYKWEHKGKQYLVFVKKTKSDIFFSEYLAGYLFYSALKSDFYLKLYFRTKGKLTKIDKENLQFLKVIDIQEITKKNNLFKIF